MHRTYSKVLGERAPQGALGHSSGLAQISYADRQTVFARQELEAPSYELIALDNRAPYLLVAPIVAGRLRSEDTRHFVPKLIFGRKQRRYISHSSAKRLAK
jgi:hypothetical protein